MAATVTVTGTAGPGKTVTAAVFTDILAFQIDCVNNILTLTDSTGVLPAISIAEAVTITVTKSDSTYTLTIANV